MLSNNAVRYTLNHLFAVALPADEALRYAVGITEQEVVVLFDAGKSLALPLFSEKQQKAFLDGTLECRWMDSADGKVQIPLFPAGDGHHPLPYDLVTPSFVLLSRQEETLSQERDTHGRFPYKGSLADKYGFVHLPLVDEYAMLLRRWIMDNLLPDYPLVPRQPQVVPTHDVDHLFRFHGWGQALKSIFGRDLLINRRLADVRTSLREYRACRRDSSKDPYVLAIDELIEQSKVRNLKSVFFFKALRYLEPDCTYNIGDAVVRGCVERIQQAGMGVGIHGSYESYADPERFAVEKSRMEQLLHQEVTAGRQHYLRFACGTPAGPPPETEPSQRTGTLQVWAQNGMTDDYTLGFAEQVGFRCGTCHPYLLYDLEKDEPTAVMEHPLIVMDGTLWDYMNLSVDQSNEWIARLRRRCAAVEGDFVILWHNHLLGRNYREAYQSIYLQQI